MTHNWITQRNSIACIALHCTLRSLTLHQCLGLVVKAPERVYSDAPRCPAVVSPLPLSSYHSFQQEPARQPKGKSQFLYQ